MLQLSGYLLKSWVFHIVHSETNLSNENDFSQVCTTRVQPIDNLPKLRGIPNQRELRRQVFLSLHCETDLTKHSTYSGRMRNNL